LFTDDSEEDMAESSPGETVGLDSSSLFLGGTSISNLSTRHPPKTFLLKIWEIYLDRSDPLMKMIHVPSVQKLIDIVIKDPSRLSKSNEALLFTIYYAAVSSLSPDECLQIMSVEKDHIYAKCRAHAQQALVNAAFLRSTSLGTLQAYYIYIVGLLPKENF
jgi:hypothetical protein